jgi:hypothetical protein
MSATEPVLTERTEGEKQAYLQGFRQGAEFVLRSLRKVEREKTIFVDAHCKEDPEP